MKPIPKQSKHHFAMRCCAHCQEPTVTPYTHMLVNFITEHGGLWPAFTGAICSVCVAEARQAINDCNLKQVERMALRILAEITGPDSDAYLGSVTGLDFDPSPYLERNSLPAWLVELGAADEVGAMMERWMFSAGAVCVKEVQQ